MRGSPGEASTDPDLHVTPAQLAARAAGTMSAKEIAVIERHLEICQDCRLDEAGKDPLAETKPASIPPTPYRARILGTLNERYEIKRPIGSGGMGTVYEALDLHLHRMVALKLLRVESEDPTEREVAANRLIREARAMAVLSHRNVVTVYDVGMHGTQVFVAMQLVDGSTLRAWLADRSRTVAQILSVMHDAGTGLAAAHAAGLIHRDFKPDNLLISRRGTARVTDFGLARRADLNDTALTTHDRVSGPKIVDVDTHPNVTRSGAIVGTPAYMAPEQVQADPCDARCDQFSFCVTTWEALFGSRPYVGSTWSEIYANVVSGNIIEPADDRAVPRPVVRALRRGLSAKSTERFPSMTELLAALDDALQARARRRRNHQWIALFSFGAVAATVIVLIAVDRPREHRPAPATAPVSAAVAEPPAPTTVTATPIDPVPPQPVVTQPVVTQPVVVSEPQAERPARPKRPVTSAVATTTPDTVITTKPEVAAPADTVDPRLADLATARKDVRDEARARGLLASDLPASYRSALVAADDALAASDADRATKEIERARAAVRGVVIDRAFVDQKLQRMNEGLGALPAERREELAGLLREVMVAAGRGDHATANRKLNQIAARLGSTR